VTVTEFSNPRSKTDSLQDALPPQAIIAPSLRLRTFPSFTTQHQWHYMRSELRPFQVGLRNNLLIIPVPQRCSRPDVATKEHDHIILSLPMTINDIKRRPTPSRDPGDEDDNDADSNSPAPSTIRLHSVRTVARGNVAGIKY